MADHRRPMRILIVNPNTTVSMTEKIGACARQAASPATEVAAVNPSMGPASIEGYYDEALSLPGLLEEIRRGEAAGFDGTVIACFDDTGLDAARSLAAGPVVGICEAAMHVAAMLGGGFSVVTTLARSVPALQALARRYGVADRCRVRAAGVPVLALEDPASGAVRRVEEEIARAVRDDGAECIVLRRHGRSRGRPHHAARPARDRRRRRGHPPGRGARRPRTADQQGGRLRVPGGKGVRRRDGPLRPAGFRFRLSAAPPRRNTGAYAGAPGLRLHESRSARSIRVSRRTGSRTRGMGGERPNGCPS